MRYHLVDLSGPINRNLDINRGLECFCPGYDGTFGTLSIRDLAKNNHVSLGSGTTLSLGGPSGLKTIHSASNYTIGSGVWRNINGVGKVTVALWIYPTGSFASYRAVWDTTNRHCSFFINTSTDLYVAFGSSAAGITSSVPFTLNEWQFVSLTYNGLAVRCYRNGKYVGTVNLGLSVFSDTLVFGTNPSGGGSNYQGYQACPRIWSRTLGDGEQSELYNLAKRDLLETLQPINPPESSPEPPPSLALDSGSFTLTGQDVTLRYSVTTMPFDTGYFTLTGQDLTLRYVSMEMGFGSFLLAGQDVNFLHYVPAAYSLALGTGQFSMTGKRVQLYITPHLGDPTQNIFIGRFRRGTSIDITIDPRSETVECPTVYIWKEGTTLVKTVQLPLGDDNLPVFSTSVYLDDDFTDGHYVAVIKYFIAYNQIQHYHYFQVSGGITAGFVTSILEMRRALGRAVIMHRDDGNIAMAYNPRVE